MHAGPNESVEPRGELRGDRTGLVALVIEPDHRNQFAHGPGYEQLVGFVELGVRDVADRVRDAILLAQLDHGGPAGHFGRGCTDRPDQHGQFHPVRHPIGGEPRSDR